MLTLFRLLLVVQQYSFIAVVFVFIFLENGQRDPANIGLSEDERLVRNQDHGPPASVHDYEEHQSESVAPCRAVREHPQLARSRSTERKHALLNRGV